MDDVGTEILLRQVQQGDRAALEELYNRYLMRVLAAVRVRLGPGLRRKIESWDIVQDVMMDALKKVDSFEYRSDGAFLKYLSRLVENRIRDEADRYSAQKRDQNREVPLVVGSSSGSEVPLDLSVAPSVPSPSQILSTQEDLVRLELAMDKLGETSPEYRELIIAARIEGLTYREISEETGKSVDAVRMQLNRAMVALTKAFRELDRDLKNGN